MTKTIGVLYRFAPWMLLWVAIIHIGWAVTLQLSDRVETLLVFGGLDPFVEAGLSPMGLSILLLIVSVMALIGLFNENKLTRTRLILLLLPQYVLVIISLISDLWLMVHGAADQGVQDRALIYALLQTYIVGSVFHTGSIFERYFLRWVDA